MKQATYVVVCLLMAAVVQEVTCDVFTSMTRIKEMVLNEREILNRIRNSVPSLGDGEMIRFYQQRDSIIRGRNLTKEKERLNHPNGVYSIIKEFHDGYEPLRQTMRSSGVSDVDTILSDVADDQDLEGARESLIRLQEVYNLQPQDLVKGQYLNYKGPVLNATDAHLVGKAAFKIGKYPQAVQWLTAASNLLQQDQGLTKSYSGNMDVSDFGRIATTKNSELADVTALLGRAFLKVGERNKASEEYSKLKMGELNIGDAVELKKELNDITSYQATAIDSRVSAFRKLCLQQSKTVGKFKDRRLRCRYALVFLPYYRFKEEIVSNTPYVSVFYNVINDGEEEIIKKQTFAKMYRGKVSEGIETAATTSDRTSHIGFLPDNESKTAEFISQRIKYLTGLDTRSGAAEPHQVVNYGLGGHYTVHLDVFVVKRPDMVEMMDNYGNRMATFLIYVAQELKFTEGVSAVPNPNALCRPNKTQLLAE
ncbi:hypothetical protein Btru_074019 [Bulinus truncatus]|nr:hypothetical protein Btru_074019 [Bulinus truncatus]